jgi:hypothetical protein
MTGVIYCDSIEELVQILIEKEMYGRYNNMLIRLAKHYKLNKNDNFYVKRK